VGPCGIAPVEQPGLAPVSRQTFDQQTVPLAQAIDDISLAGFISMPARGNGLLIESLPATGARPGFCSTGCNFPTGPTPGPHRERALSMTSHGGAYRAEAVAYPDLISPPRGGSGPS